MKCNFQTKMQAADISNINLINKYGNCRCCLSLGHHEHTFGIPEMELLMENLNLFLLADPRLPDLLCSICFTSLNDVQHFRQKVLITEAKLHQIIQQDINQAARSTFTEAFSTNAIQQSKNEPFEKIVVKSEEVDDDLQRDGTAHTAAFSTNAIQQSTNEPFEKIVVKSEEVDYDLQRDGTAHTADASYSFGTVKIELDTEASEGLIDTQPILPEALETESQVDPFVRRTFTDENPHIKKKKDHIMIDKKIEIATDKTKNRANLIVVLQNSTILPFRCTADHIFKCFYCENTYTIFKDLRKHTKMDHVKGAKDYTIYKWLRARQHKMIHADISDTKCKICRVKFENIHDLVTHLTEIHEKVYYDIKYSEKGPTHGVLAARLDSDTLKCHMCRKEFRFYKQIIDHMNEHYGSFVCHVCGKILVTEPRLKNHLMCHDNSKTQCPECKKTFRSKHSFYIHRMRMHTDMTSECGECKKQFSTRNKKLEHMEKIHGIMRAEYKCEFCEKTFYIRSSFNRHRMLVHIKANEIKCDICAYATANKQAMKNHIDYHNGVKNFECDYCKNKFRTKTSIEMHIRMHINMKRFACSLCDAAYIQKQCLKQHIKSKHPDSKIDINTLKFGR